MGRCAEPDVGAQCGPGPDEARLPVRQSRFVGEVGGASRGGSGGRCAAGGVRRRDVHDERVGSGGDRGSLRQHGKLGAQSLTLVQAQDQLKPIQDKVSAVAQQNVALPIGSKLQSLADALTKVEQVNPGTTSQLPADASDIGTAAKNVVDACAQVAR